MQIALKRCKPNERRKKSSHSQQNTTHQYNVSNASDNGPMLINVVYSSVLRVVVRILFGFFFTSLE